MPATSTPLPSSAQARADLARDLGRAMRILGGVLMLLWGILIVDTLLFGGQLWHYGLLPRTIVGLRGILFAPFLHGGFMHLFLNSIGFVLFGGLVVFREERYFWIVSAMGVFVGGALLWALGRGTMVVGASGVIFAYLGYLLFAGIFERRIGSIILSTFVAFVWGGALLGMLPGQPGISWEGHLFGFISGALAARMLARESRT